MKAFYFLGLICFSVSLHATEKSTCEIQKHNLTMAMQVISNNMANVNTTRAPAGGPYKRQKLECEEGSCQMIYFDGFKVRYEPGHLDANEIGYVLYPDIDMMQEMEDMIQATRDYEDVVKNCKP